MSEIKLHLKEAHCLITRSLDPQAISNAPAVHGIREIYSSSHSQGLGKTKKIDEDWVG